MDNDGGQIPNRALDKATTEWGGSLIDNATFHTKTTRGREIQAQTTLRNLGAFRVPQGADPSALASEIATRAVEARRTVNVIPSTFGAFALATFRAKEAGALAPAHLALAMQAIAKANTAALDAVITATPIFAVAKAITARAADPDLPNYPAVIAAMPEVDAAAAPFTIDDHAARRNLRLTTRAYHDNPTDENLGKLGIAIHAAAQRRVLDPDFNECLANAITAAPGDKRLALRELVESAPSASKRLVFGKSPLAPAAPNDRARAALITTLTNYACNPHNDDYQTAYEAAWNGDLLTNAAAQITGPDAVRKNLARAARAVRAAPDDEHIYRLAIACKAAKRDDVVPELDRDLNAIADDGYTFEDTFLNALQYRNAFSLDVLVKNTAKFLGPHKVHFKDALRNRSLRDVWQRQTPDPKLVALGEAYLAHMRTPEDPDIAQTFDQAVHSTYAQETIPNHFNTRELARANLARTVADYSANPDDPKALGALLAGGIAAGKQGILHPDGLGLLGDAVNAGPPAQRPDVLRTLKALRTVAPYDAIGAWTPWLRKSPAAPDDPNAAANLGDALIAHARNPRDPGLTETYNRARQAPAVNAVVASITSPEAAKKNLARATRALIAAHPADANRHLGILDIALKAAQVNRAVPDDHFKNNLQRFAATVTASPAEQRAALDKLIAAAPSKSKSLRLHRSPAAPAAPDAAADVGAALTNYARNPQDANLQAYQTALNAAAGPVVDGLVDAPAARENLALAVRAVNADASDANVGNLAIAYKAAQDREVTLLPGFQERLEAAARDRNALTLNPLLKDAPLGQRKVARAGFRAPAPDPSAPLRTVSQPFSPAPIPEWYPPFQATEVAPVTDPAGKDDVVSLSGSTIAPSIAPSNSSTLVPEDSEILPPSEAQAARRPQPRKEASRGTARPRQRRVRPRRHIHPRQWRRRRRGRLHSFPASRTRVKIRRPGTRGSRRTYARANLSHLQRNLKAEPRPNVSMKKVDNRRPMKKPTDRSNAYPKKTLSNTHPHNPIAHANVQR